MNNSRLTMAALGAALVLGGTACGKLKDAAGGKVPGGMPSTSLDPNACGGFSAGGEVGHKIHAFLEATQELDKVAAETAEVIKSSCAIMGKDLGMSDADMGGETDAVCGKVINTIQQNLQVSVKSKAALHIVAKPAECKADLEVQAKAAGDCEGKADVGPGGANASQECRATGSIKVAAAVQCTPPQFSIEADAKMVVDKAKLDMTIKALQDGIPKILDVKGRVEPLKTAVEQWAASVVALKDAGSKLTDAFKDQALCVGSQLGFAANMVGHIKANVSVSVSVSASASGTVGG